MSGTPNRSDRAVNNWCDDFSSACMFKPNLKVAKKAAIENTKTPAAAKLSLCCKKILIEYAPAITISISERAK